MMTRTASAGHIYEITFIFRAMNDEQALAYLNPGPDGPYWPRGTRLRIIDRSRRRELRTALFIGLLVGFWALAGTAFVRWLHG